MAEVRETTGQLKSTEAIERLEQYTVVDCDVHEIVTDPSVFTDYLDEPWRSRVNHITSTDDPLTQSVIGTQPHDVDPTPHGLDDGVTPTTPEGMKNFMDRFNADYLIFHGHEVEGIADVPDREFAAELCAAYNDYMLDQYLDEYEGFKSSIRVAPQAPERAAEEIYRLADEKDMVAVHIPAAPNGLLGNPEFDPIYQAAEDVGLSVDYHPSQSNIPWSGLWGGPWLQSTAEFMGVYGHHMMAHIPNLIFEGVPERFPNVKHVFIEQGVTWIPWLMGRMDKYYERRGHVLPELEMKPSEYLKEYFYFGTQPIEDVAGPGQISALFEMMDAKELLVYTTDFPHFDFDYPSALTIPGMDEETERRIFGENALDVYRI